MFAKSVFITGSNRGIGLELVKQLVDQTDHLFAGCRSPNLAEVSMCQHGLSLVTLYYEGFLKT